MNGATIVQDDAALDVVFQDGEPMVVEGADESLIIDDLGHAVASVGSLSALATLNTAVYKSILVDGLGVWEWVAGNGSAFLSDTENYRASATDTGALTGIWRKRDYGSIRFNIQNYGDTADIIQAGGVRQTKTPLQNSLAIDNLMEDIYGYHGGGKLIVPAVGQINTDYAIMPRYSNFTFEGFGAGSHLYNANPSAAFWVADGFVIGNFGEPSFPRVYNGGHFKTLLSTNDNANRVTFATAGDVAALGVAVGHVLLITSNEWIEPALVAAGLSAGAAATAAASNTGTMLINSNFTPVFSDLNEVVRIDGADVYLRYPLPYALTSPRVANMDTQTVVISGTFGTSGRNWPLLAPKNIHIRNMQISTNPANGNGMPIQASSMVGCSFENLILNGRGVLYGNLMCHSIFRRIYATFYDTFADLKVGPNDMVYEDIYALFSQNPAFVQPLNVLWSPDSRAVNTVFNRVHCDAIGHTGSLRLGGRDMRYEDCEFNASSTFNLIDIPALTVTPTRQRLRFKRVSHPNTAARLLNASAGNDISIEIGESKGNFVNNTAIIGAGVQGLRLRAPLPFDATVTNNGAGCVVEEIRPAWDNLAFNVNQGNVVSTTPNNVIRTITIPAGAPSKRSRLRLSLFGALATAPGTNLRVLVDGVEAVLITGSASESFEAVIDLYCRTATTNQRWSAKAMRDSTTTVRRGTMVKDISTTPFDIQIQGWSTSGTITIDEIRLETIPARY